MGNCHTAYVLMDDKKTVVTDKNFENSLFTKLFLEKSGNNYLKLICESKSVAVWDRPEEGRLHFYFLSNLMNCTILIIYD